MTTLTASQIDIISPTATTGPSLGYDDPSDFDRYIVQVDGQYYSAHHFIDGAMATVRALLGDAGVTPVRDLTVAWHRWTLDQ